MEYENYEQNPYVPNIHFELIRIRDLVSNQDYQRKIYVANIRRTEAELNIYQINQVKVSQRDGNN